MHLKSDLESCCNVKERKQKLLICALAYIYDDNFRVNKGKNYANVQISIIFAFILTLQNNNFIIRF